MGTTQTAKQEQGSIEKWVSTAWTEHMIVIPNPNKRSPKDDPNGATKSMTVRFKDYRVDVDTSTEEGKAVSEGLRKCGRWGRDIFLIGQKLDEKNIEARADLMRILNYMDIAQLRAVIGRDGLIDVGFQPSTLDRDELVTAIVATRSLVGKSN